MMKLFAAMLGLAVALEGIASAQTSPARIAYDSCGAIGWEEYVCTIVAGGITVFQASGIDSALGPKWSPDGSRVALVASAEILVVNPANGTVVNVTNHQAADGAPAWSRDGAKIAFASTRNGLAELHVVNADGSNVVRLTDRVGFSGQPVWSPDDLRIAFGCEVEIGNQDICAIRPDGSGLARLTADPARDYGAAFSRAGDRIAFVTDRFGSETIAVLEGGGTVRGVIRGTDPAWSPDGTRIAFTYGADVFTVSAAGGTAVNLTNDALGYYAPVWSPDGRDVAFGGTSIAGYTGTCYFGGGAHNADDFCVPATGIYVASADGSAHNLIGLGANPDWFVAPPGRPLASFTSECTGSICEFDGSRSFDNDGTIVSYAWQFGDGTNGSGPTPHHAYAIGGRYVITLTVTDDSGTTGALSRTTDANALPVAVLAVTCNGPTCTFDASGSADPDGTIAIYSFSFGDGHSSGFSTSPTTSHTYATGTFTATLEVQDNGGAVAVQTTTVSVINVLPVATFTHACSTRTCAFNGSGSFDSDGHISNYVWTFGDAGVGSGGTASHTYAAAGTYAVTLTVFDNTGQQTVASRTLSFVNTAPIAAFTDACGSLTCTFNATASTDSDGAITAYSWAFGDGTTGFGPFVTHTYAASGSYQVTLTVVDNGARTNTQSKTIAVVRTMHVGDLDLSGANQQAAWAAVVTVTIDDGGHTPLAGAYVSGSWSNGLTGSCTTNLLGQCKLSNAAIPKKIGNITFRAVAVTHPTATYRSADNHDSEGDSDGTTVRVSKP